MVGFFERSSWFLNNIPRPCAGYVMSRDWVKRGLLGSVMLMVSAALPLVVAAAVIKDKTGTDHEPKPPAQRAMASVRRVVVRPHQSAPPSPGGPRPDASMPTVVEGPSVVVVEEARQEKPAYVPGQFVVKFKDSLTECAHCLLEKRQRFAGALSDSAESLDRLNHQCQVKAARHCFQDRCGLTTRQAQARSQEETQRIKQTFPTRAQRASKDARPTDLTDVYILEIPQEADVKETCRLYQADPHVEYAHPNYLVDAQLVPNDPY